MTLPLEGIKILEFSRTLAGPLAGQLLGDLGAEIIKVEQPEVGDESRQFPPYWDEESCYFLSSNRNKQSITVDLKNPKGIEIIHKLVKESDVVTESFRTGKAEELGIGYNDLKTINPKLIYLSISGFGRTGPDRFKAGYDIILQGYGGIMGMTGEPNKEPVKAGPSVADVLTGVLGAFSVLSALLDKEKSNKGQYIDCSLLDSQIMLLNHIATGYQATGKSAKPMGSAHQSLVPYQAFKTKDKFIIIAAGNDRLWKKMCKVLRWDDLHDNSRFATNQQRVLHRDEIIKMMSERIIELSSDDTIDKLDSVGVPACHINNIEEVITSPQVTARNMMVDISHPLVEGLKAPAFPVKFSEINPEIRRHPPLLGEHTDEVLTQLGYTSDEIETLKFRKVL